MDEARGARRGRPRSFDRDDALHNAMLAFWRGGLAETTYAHLEDATGLHRQSLAYAFGDKAALFREALQRYADDKVDAVVERLHPADGRALDGVRATLALWIDDARRESTPGCLLVNAAGELGRPSDPEVGRILDAASDRLVQAFAAAFRRAQEAGEISERLDPDALAHLAVAAGDGALLRSRAGGDPDFARKALSALLGLLDP